MSLPKKLAACFREIHTGTNRTGVTMADALIGVDWKQATTKVSSLNTIAALVFHIDYYVNAVLKVLQGGPLDAHDKFSYDVPPIRSEEEWRQLLDKTAQNARLFADLVEQLDEAQLEEDFVKPQYGTWYRNIQGIIEHSYYHLGQISLIRKLMQEQAMQE